MDMAAELKLSLILVAFLSLSVSATPSSSHLTSTNDELSKDVADHENFVEQYLMQFHNRVWEVLASHGVLLGVNCSCNLHPNIVVLFGHFEICNAPLVPSWVLAVIIGLFFGHKFYNLGPSVTGSLSYSITYTMYAVMITSGLIVHCLFLVECGAESANQIYVDVAKIDGSLTSCIAISFLFNALVDARLIPEREFGTMIMMLVVYVWVFYAYFVQLVSPTLLYFATVGICCGLYLVFQFALTVHNGCRAIGYLIASGIVGGVSMWLIKEDYCWLCYTLGAWSVQGVWYYGSDLAMLLVAIYVSKTRCQSLCHSLKKNDTKCTEKTLKQEMRTFHI